MPYVKIKEIKRIRQGGQLQTYHPGDTVEVGKQTALSWILDGSASDPFEQVGPAAYERDNVEFGEYGIHILDSEGSVSPTYFDRVMEAVPVSYGEPDIPYEHTFLWNPLVPVSPQLLNYGWLRISKDNPPQERWEMAATLLRIELTAADVGTAEEKQGTEKLIGDLRLPVYESGLLWIRQCPNSQKVIRSYAKYLDKGVHRYHAFLRALYSERAMLCTLPLDWTRR